MPPSSTASPTPLEPLSAPPGERLETVPSIGDDRAAGVAHRSGRTSARVIELVLRADGEFAPLASEINRGELLKLLDSIADRVSVGDIDRVP